ncbi:oxidoreductase [Rhodobacterales bacterium 52_120_T64]|nr:oxidoreductase [Rhodobacterales bacterium 52_120_T64]
MNIGAGTIALVTGASRGLGYATAVELARQGAHVIALAKTVGGLEELADEIETVGGSCTLVPLDITDESGLQRMCVAIHERWGHLDLLVHCAVHAVLLSPVAHVSDKDFDRMWAVNARATQRIIAMTEPLLKAAEEGTAVFMDDPRGGKKFFAGYGSTKAAAQAIVDSWAAETVTIGPRVLTFSPNPMPTGIRARFFPGENREKLASTSDEAKRLLDHIS